MIDLKRILYAIAAVSAAAMLASCTPDNPDKPDNPEPEPVPDIEPVTLTVNFVLPSGSLKTKWVAGDDIVVHGEYAKNQVTVTLESSDISSDGRKATKTIEIIPYENEECTSNLYASWPAEAVDNLPHCFWYSKFNNTNTQLLAACNNGDTFNFEDVLGAITFSLSDKYDAFEIKGARKERIGYEFLQVLVTDKDKNFSQYLGAPILEMSGKAGANNSVFMPDGTILSHGFSIKFIKNGSYVKIYKNDDPIEIQRGKVIDLGDISADLEDYDDPFSADILSLDTDATANCYIVSATGKYKFKAVKGNNPTDFLDGVEDAAVLWETWNNAEEVIAGSVVESVTYAEDYMIIHMPATLHPGNAVVAARDADGKILWSWHIWVPQTGIVTNDYGIYSSKMMDRNLGALVAATADAPAPVESFGLTYQWGRKDPFPGPAEPGIGDNATVAGMEVTQTPGAGGGTESLISLQESIENPTVLGHSQNGDWLNEIDSSLWTDMEKTIYDPCPPGYRVPARVSTQPFHSSDLTTQAGWSESVDNRSFTLGNPVAVFPLAGYRDDYGPGTLTHTYDRAVYWTAYASADGVTGYYVNVRSPNNKHGLSEAGKSRAGSVRCVAE